MKKRENILFYSINNCIATRQFLTSIIILMVLFSNGLVAQNNSIKENET